MGGDFLYLFFIFYTPVFKRFCIFMINAFKFSVYVNIFSISKLDKLIINFVITLGVSFTSVS